MFDYDLVNNSFQGNANCLAMWVINNQLLLNFTPVFYDTYMIRYRKGKY